MDDHALEDLVGLEPALEHVDLHGRDLELVPDQLELAQHLRSLLTFTRALQWVLINMHHVHGVQLPGLGIHLDCLGYLDRKIPLLKNEG